jgi:hypothetical protein
MGRPHGSVTPPSAVLAVPDAILGPDLMLILSSNFRTEPTLIASRNNLSWGRLGYPVKFRMELAVRSKSCGSA